MAAPHLEEPVLRHARTRFVSIPAGGSVEDALRAARESDAGGRIVYFYAVDDGGRLVGVVPTRELLMSDPDTPVARLMSPPISIPSTASLMDACEFFLLHRFLALPVVDAQGRLVGVVDVEVYAEEMSELSRAEAQREDAEDFFQLIGVRLAEVRRAGPGAAFAARFPWLLCNIAGGIAAAVVAGFFQGVLDRIVAVALFIPVVLAVAESVSIQSLTLTLQAHHSLSRMRLRRVVQELLREAPVGALLGVSCAATIAAAVGLWQGDGALAMCLLISVSVTMVIAALLGVLVPTTLHALRCDPRIASGPIVLTATDLSTLTLYLWLAATLLD
ncbi:magnesium transporter [Botrimarina sp.]|uniref:magnesium transporter n=1 Tax=Botrimarina sp. TaxID=2795802 RepID=UPI0032ECEA3F